jgi:thiosulfate reductase/polysulfide reductase chain A
VLAGAAWIRQPVIEPRGGAKSALWIYKQLGERLGLADYFQYADEEDYLRQQLAPLGVDLEALKQHGFYRPPSEPEAEKDFVFNTPSGKIEVHSTVLEQAGYPALPTWEEPLAPAAGEFYLLTGKVGQHTQFATQNNQWLHEVFPRNALWIHPQAAAERSIVMNDLVRVSSPAGEVTIEAFVTEGIRPDCVYLTPGFGHLSKGLQTAYGEGAADSDLHLTFTDPVSGGQALTQTFVKVEKA